MYKVYSKSIKTEVLLTKTEMNNEWNVIFFKIVLLSIEHIYFSGFSIDESISETSLLIWYEAML